jgi:NADPH2:quinone reductase
MKALLCNRHGPPSSLVVEEVAKALSGPREVVGGRQGCRDQLPGFLIIQDKYQLKSPLPFTDRENAADLSTLS